MGPALRISDPNADRPKSEEPFPFGRAPKVASRLNSKEALANSFFERIDLMMILRIDSLKWIKKLGAEKIASPNSLLKLDLFFIKVILDNQSFSASESLITKSYVRTFFIRSQVTESYKEIQIIETALFRQVIQIISSVDEEFV